MEDGVAWTQNSLITHNIIKFVFQYIGEEIKSSNLESKIHTPINTLSVIWTHNNPYENYASTAIRWNHGAENVCNEALPNIEMHFL